MMRKKPFSASDSSRLTNVQMSLLVVLRLFIGWHFLFEGVIKLFNPNWTAGVFLAKSKWLFADVFHSIANNPTVLTLVDQLNIWGLILIGLGLFFGLFTRVAAISGIVLLALYYVANPPLLGFSNGMPTEGSYLLIDKNLIEIAALLVLAIFPTGRFFGFDGLIAASRNNKQNTAPAQPSRKPRPAAASTASVNLQRREMLKSLATVPLFGGFVYAYLRKQGWESYEVKTLMSEKVKNDPDAMTGATLKTFQFTSLKELQGTLPKGKIGNLEISRLFLGGNLIGGWAHARDLIYVSKLVKSYHSDRKVFDTLWLAEQAGIDTLLTNPQLCRVINEYWRKEKGKIQFISDCGYRMDCLQGLEMSVDGGAHSAYIQGEIADRLVPKQDFDTIQTFLDRARQHGISAGIGAHKLETVQAIVEQGIEPDYWVKTLHHVNYWSANKTNQHDNIWCVNPEQTIAFMENLKQPWIAFKTLAAGAISPEEGFQYAFENGADFICVGMYDFQIVEDVNIALNVLGSDLQNRRRAWRA